MGQMHELNSRKGKCLGQDILQPVSDKGWDLNTGPLDIQSASIPAVSHCRLIPVSKACDNRFGILALEVIWEATKPAFHMKKVFSTFQAIHSNLFYLIQNGMI